MTTQDNATLPTRQMEPIKLDNLLINFTTEFQRIWDTNGTRAKTVAFWRPTPAPDALPGYFPLGDIAIHRDGNINGEMTAVVVREGNSPGDDTKGNALSRPTDFELYWKDTGSGAVTRASIWRPIPPAGYVALGLVCANDYNKPSLNAVRCVRADLVIAANVSDLIWNDKGSGAKMSFSAWSIEPPTAEPGDLYFTPGTFTGNQSYSKPETPVTAYALRMQIPLQVTSPPQAPALSGHAKPPVDEAANVTQIARLPWFAVIDYVQPSEQLLKSPYYDLKRTDQYVLVGYERNTTDKTRPIKWAIDQAQSARQMQSFNRQTSVEFERAWPNTAPSDVRTTKFSACLPKHFTHTESGSNGWSESLPLVIIAMAAKHKSVAVYLLESHYELTREDGTQVTGKFGYTDGSSVHLTQYPPEKEECPPLTTGTSTGTDTVENTSDANVIAQASPDLPTATDTVP